MMLRVWSLGAALTPALSQREREPEGPCTSHALALLQDALCVAPLSRNAGRGWEGGRSPSGSLIPAQVAVVGGLAQRGGG